MNLGETPQQLFDRYQDLQRYVRWTPEDARRVLAAGMLVEPHFGELIDDFYDEIRRHEDAARVITGGEAQVERLKGLLHIWLQELFSGVYDVHYVWRRWQVGLRHVEIGLPQVYTNAALSRLRAGLLALLHSAGPLTIAELMATRESLNKLLDLDLAIIEDAYQAAYFERQQRSERLIAVGQIAGGIAHELRNPLNVVKTSVYYLLHAKNPTPEKTAEHLQRIERQIGLADRVITSLSDFAKLKFPELKPINVADSVSEALELSNVPAQLRVSVDIPADLRAVLADPDQLRIVLSNLIRNARDAMPDGGELRIAASNHGERVTISVQDTGQGIPPESLGRIMEPLYSTKSRGLGLGLAIARSILEKHQGQLSVASTPGEGSTFIVNLPATDPPGSSF